MKGKIERKRDTLEQLAATDFDIDADGDIHTADEIATALLEIAESEAQS